MQHAENLVRKQYLIAPRHIDKLKAIAEKQKTSSAEVVRMAIDAFEPDSPSGMDQTELMELVSARLKEAIKDTQETRARLQATLAALKGEK